MTLTTTSQPLYDEAAEVAMLGAVMRRNEALDDVSDVLQPEHFGREHHRRTFRAMLALHRDGTAIDPVTVRAQLERQGDAADVSAAFVYQLGDGVPTSLNVGWYAGLIRERALQRALRDHARRLLVEAESVECDVPALLQEAEQAVFRLSTQHTPGEWVSSETIAGELYPVLERLSETHSPVTGIATGFLDLDRMTRGLQPADLVIVGARPSVGKSALALQIALQAAHTLPVACFSLEMTRASLGQRAISVLTGLDSWRLQNGRMSDADYRLAGDGLSRFGNAKLWIDESPMLSPIQARSKLRRMRAKHGVGLVVIDYLQLMAPLPEHTRENRTTQVSGISRMLKLLAKEFNVPFLVLAQLNRGLERSGDRRPQLSDLRESGAIEQDADVVLLLHRPEMHEPEKPELKGVAELIVAKQRNGPVGVARLLWRPECTRFDNWREVA